MMKSKYLIVFVIMFLIGVAVASALLYTLSSDRFVPPIVSSPRMPHPVVQNPLALRITDENKGRRCEAKRWDDVSDNPLCYKLQERLSAAVQENDLSGMKDALQKGANVNASFYQAFSPIQAAATDAKKDTVLLLLENGADVNESREWGTSPLQTAVFYRQNEIVEILLENGADACHRAKWDERDLPTPNALDIARKYGNEQAAALLTSFGAEGCF